MESLFSARVCSQPPATGTEYRGFLCCVCLQDPVVTSIMPKKGPRSGGTTVVIKGTNMDAGSDVSVTIDGGICEVHKLVYNTVYLHGQSLWVYNTVYFHGQSLWGV